MSSLIIFLIACVGFAQAGWAEVSEQQVAQLHQSVQRLGQLVEELQGTVHAQQQRIAQLEQTGPQPEPATVQPPTSAAQAGAPSVGALASQISGGNLSAFNPEIGVVADVVGQLSESSADGEGNDKLSAREVELVFAHPVDPYSRLDVTATFSDFEAAALEEAYLTRYDLPGELRARLGRMRPTIGKATTTHGERLDTVDYPLVVQRYLGNEGLFRTGLELNGFLPVPWTAVTHELAVGTMEGGVGEGGALFGETLRRPSFYAHLKNFWDISDTTNAELGATYLAGSKDDDARFEVNALGLDATFVHYATPTNKFKWQNELYLQDRDEAFSIAEDGTRTNFHDNPWGFYSLLDYRLSPRLGVGGRLDYVEPVDIDPLHLVRHADTAWSGYVTLYQSEFARWRLQYRHTNFALGGDDNTVFAQGTFIIGVDRHPLQ